MALPPKRDPNRPLHLAARSMRLLGLLLLAFGTCVGVVFTTLVPAGGGAAAPGAMRWLFVAIAGVYLGAGAGFLACAYYLKRYRQWAAIVGIVLSSLILLVLILGLLGVLLQIATGTATAGIAIQVVIQIVFLAAFGQLLYHLIGSLQAIRIHEASHPAGYGFQPIYGHAPPPLPPRPPRL